jgi:hypothetical protein
MDAPPADVKTWAQFNTWYALRHPGARLEEFSAAWEAHQTRPRPRKPRAPRPKKSRVRAEEEQEEQ